MTAQKIKGEYIYYNCTEAKGKCPQKYHKEEDVAFKLGDAIKAITIDPEIVEWIIMALKESHHDEQEFHKSTIKDMQRELAKLEGRIKLIYEDKLDSKIDDELWQSLREKYSIEIELIKKRIDRCLNANIDCYEKGSKILSLAESA
ncbi:MAG: hypothetical protein GY841_14670 [FCB group bacterium]|nr:hypothetical protein [FCB group bacterium]